MAPNPMFSHVIHYAITDRSQYGPTEAAREAGVLLQTEKLAQHGIDFIQLREKDLSAQDLLRLARNMLDVLRAADSKTRLLINSRADIAAAVGAHGVHLTSGKDQLTPVQARQVLRLEGCIISVSCHTLEDVQRARDHAADIILFGPVFGKSIAGDLVVPGTGLDTLAQACSAAGDLPVLALGGVTHDNITACIEAGAKGTAAIRLFHQPIGSVLRTDSPTTDVSSEAERREAAAPAPSSR